MTAFIPYLDIYKYSNPIFNRSLLFTTIFQLDEIKLRLVESLAIHGGNLKKVAEEMEISYPTLKNRLDEVSAILKQESEELKKKRSEILDKIEKLIHDCKTLMRKEG